MEETSIRGMLGFGRTMRLLCVSFAFVDDVGEP